MSNKGMHRKETNVNATSKGEKRKLSGESTVEETQVKEVESKKAPLKAELIVKLKALEKKYEELEQENNILKIEKENNIKTIEKLQKRVSEMEELEVYEKDTEELDLSFGPRYCEKCGHEAEDGYQLDAHYWTEHDGNDPNFFHCQQCDASFTTLKDLMAHKKKNHVENVEICWHYLNGACLFGEYCWFKHENEPKQSKKELNKESIKCNICDKIFKERNSFMIHKRKEHEENIEVCKLFKKGNCTYHEKCWFSHKNSKIDKMILNEKKIKS